MDQALGAELHPKEPLTVGAYLAQWLDHARGRVRAKTLDGYKGLISLYAIPGLGQVGLARAASPATSESSSRGAISWMVCREVPSRA